MTGRTSHLVCLAHICMLPITAASAQAQAETRFAESGASQVGFEPPFVVVAPKTSLVPILVVHLASGEVVPQAAPYTLVIPAGLQVYKDPARTLGPS